jgi:hypothetical protein
MNYKKKLGWDNLVREIWGGLENVCQIYKISVKIFKDSSDKKMKRKKPLFAYCNVKQESGRDMYIEQYSSNERIGLPRFHILLTVHHVMILGK